MQRLFFDWQLIALKCGKMEESYSILAEPSGPSQT